MGSLNFFDWLLAGIIWVIGLGSPSQHTIDVIGAYFPAILAALTVVPVYFIGKTLFNRWVGVMAAVLIAILPGEYMGRSILGFTDHHVAETLFSTVVILFLVLAIKTAGQKQLTFSHLRQRDWSTITKPLVYSLLAGIFLGIYLITWQGALLFVFIIALYLIVQFIIDHIRGKFDDHLAFIGVVAFFIALIIFLPFSPGWDFSAAIVVALLVPVILSGISRVMAGRQLKPAYYPLALVGIGIVFMAVFYAAAPDTLGVILAKFRIFAPAGATATTTLEMQPFLYPLGSFTTEVAWGNYTTNFFLLPADWINKNLLWFPGFAIIPIIISIWLFIKQRSVKEHRRLLFTLFVVMVAAALVLWFFISSGWKILFPGFAIISFVILIWLFIKQRGDEKERLLVLIWTLVILVVTLVQRRFAYYFVVNVALLSAYVSWLMIWYAGLRKLVVKPVETSESPKPPSTKDESKKARRESRGITVYHITFVLAAIIVFYLVFFFNIDKSREVASEPRFAPSDAWQSSLIWLKDNSPDPFGETDFYYKFYEPPKGGESYDYPESAYAVTSWWDYGYWITRIAHRLPNANPGQTPKPIINVAQLLLSQEENITYELMEKLDSSYVILDYQIATSKFWAVATWEGRGEDDFVGIYLLPQEGELWPVQLFYPEYYRAMCIRLYNFDGKAVTNERPVVVSYEEKVDRQENRYRQITGVKELSSYEEALDYVENQDSGNHIIVGTNPFISPVPLEALEGYRLVHSSESGISQQGGGVVPEVKVFEYVR